MPGGHVELGENIETAVLREIYEEVGIKITENEKGDLFYNEKRCKLEPLMLFESAFCKEENLFLRQAAIIFYVLKIDESFEKIPIKMQRTEVDCYSWIPFDFIPSMIKSEESTKEITAFYGQIDGSVTNRKIPIQMIYGPYPNVWGEGTAKGHIKALAKLYENFSH